MPSSRAVRGVDGKRHQAARNAPRRMHVRANHERRLGTATRCARRTRDPHHTDRSPTRSRTHPIAESAASRDAGPIRETARPTCAPRAG
ncbi:hypothetical protein BGI50_01725 [Burkholderia pseudomallei]|nr:hypothetical protein BGI50_01725 [Burkholderia pseudomallei]OMO11251.1 hypothetical protein BGI48_01725 [Burkholderia pseudomallei]